MKNIVVFDNGGETFDRFTIINKRTGEMIGASENPFDPQGFGQSCGNPAHTFFAQTIGATWISNCERRDTGHYYRIIRLKTAEIIEEFKAEGNIGKVIEFSALPADVQHFAIERFNIQIA